MSMSVKIYDGSSKRGSRLFDYTRGSRIGKALLEQLPNSAFENRVELELFRLENALKDILLESTEAKAEVLIAMANQNLQAELLEDAQEALVAEGEMRAIMHLSQMIELEVSFG